MLKSMDKNVQIFLLIVILVVLAWLVSLIGQPQLEEPELIFCTAEAKMCPDGSFVGRIPLRCDFVPCPQLDN